MNISSVFEKIAMTSKATEKKALVLQERCDLMDKIFDDTYNNSYVYGVTSNTISITTSGNATIDLNYYTFHDLLVELNKRSITGNAAIEAVNTMINQFREIDQKILVNIIDRNLKIGVSNTNYCKWCGIENTDYQVALAKHLKDVKGVNPIDGSYYASRKLDGCVSYDTIVEFEDGTKMTIKEVVDKKIYGKIKSYDETTKSVVYRSIIGGFCGVEDVNPNNNKQWYEICLENGNTLKITNNDMLYVKGKGWVEVEKLDVDDEVLVEQ